MRGERGRFGGHYGDSSNSRLGREAKGGERLLRDADRFCHQILNLLLVLLPRNRQMERTARHKDKITLVEPGNARANARLIGEFPHWKRCGLFR